MRILKIAFIVILLPVLLPAQDNQDFNNIVKAIKDGQANDLSAYFASSVECDILGQNEVCSKSQATQVMKDFFAQHKAKSFSVLHHSGKNQAKYIIGSYVTIAGKTYRITCIVKQTSESYLIQQIRIENDAKIADA
jgi:hypothetical protein